MMNMKYGDFFVRSSKVVHKEKYFYEDSLVKNGSDLFGTCPGCKEKNKHFEVFTHKDGYLCIYSRCCDTSWYVKDNIKFYINFSKIENSNERVKLDYKNSELYRFRFDPLNVASRKRKRRLSFRKIYCMSISQYRHIYDEQLLYDDSIVFYDKRTAVRYKNYFSDFYNHRSNRTWKNKKHKKQWMKNI